MIPLPYFEDIVDIYIKYITNTLFPNIRKNRLLVYAIAFLHILGTIQIVVGVFLPPSYQPFVLLYLLMIASSYYFFDGHCFMTLLANKYSNLKESPLHIRMKTAQTVLLTNIIIALIGTLFPKYSLFKIIQRLFSD